LGGKNPLAKCVNSRLSPPRQTGWNAQKRGKKKQDIRGLKKPPRDALTETISPKHPGLSPSYEKEFLEP